jgi:cysteine-rich repeat protein
MTHSWLVVVSGVAHLAVAGGLFVSGVWHIERLKAPRVDVRPITVVSQPPAPSGGSVAPDPPKIEPKHKPKPTVTVQPDRSKHPEHLPEVTGPEDRGDGPGPGSPTDTGTCRENNCGETPAAPPVCGNSSLETGEQCDDSNTVNGDGCSSTCRTEAKPVPPARPQILQPTMLQALRISGETQIHPSIATRNMMMRANDSSVRGVILVCIATDGRVASVTLQHSTKYQDYDQALLSGVHTWQYRPYMMNGAAVPACGIVNFDYRMH